MLPGYNKNRYNASLVLSGLRSSDSGLYRCEVVVGINDEQDTVPLEVTGKYIFFLIKEAALNGSHTWSGLCQDRENLAVSLSHLTNFRISA